MPFFNEQSNLAMLFLLVILAVYLWYAFCVIYHLLRFGIGAKPKLLALIFFIGSFILFLAVLVAFSQVNWQTILQQIKDIFSSTISTY
jgi:RsiW-degrading membrane proteinase PrsW (M82 family)